MSKEKLTILIVCIIFLSLGFLVYVISGSTRNRVNSQDEGNTQLIQKAINNYISESNDVMLENLNVISGETKWHELILDMHYEIKDKNDPSISFKPPFYSNDRLSITYKNYLPNDKHYIGYRIEIDTEKKVAKVALCKNEADSVVIIN